jgi:3-oxoadipate CoA-transferase alpha subunit
MRFDDDAPEGTQRMINKIVQSMADAMAGIKDGSTVLIGGFGAVGQPNALIDGLIEQGATDLTVAANNAGVGHVGLARLMELGRVRKIVCSFPRSSDPVVFESLPGDVALVEAWEADRWGNLTFKESGRNFNPVMAMAGKLTIVQTQHVRELGELEPDHVVTPGIFVDRVLHVPYGDPTGF